MPEDFVQSIAERVAAIAKKTAASASPIRVGTVTSVNGDGTVNVDTGDGGCAVVSAVSNQVVTCGSTVVLGLEPQPGNTTDLCQVQFAINSSSKGCPVEDRIDDNEVEEPVTAALVFVDNRGHVYDYQTGALLATGTTWGGSGHPPHWSGTYLGNEYFATEGDIAYGYASDLGVSANYAGVLDDAGLALNSPPNYNDAVIGDPSSSPNNAGYQGESYTINNNVYIGRLVLGQGASTDRLMGMEVVNDAAGIHGPNWTVVIRSAADYSIIATNAGAYLTTWVTDFMYGDPVANAVSVAADPDGSFWITPVNGRTDGNNFPNPMFNVSAADGSLIRTVELDTPASGVYVYASPVAII